MSPKGMTEVLSLRLDPDLAAGLREVANHRGTTVSDLLREAAGRIVGFHEPDQPPVEVLANFEAAVERGYVGTTGYTRPSSQTWGCGHLTISGPIHASPTSGCGCVMSLVETS